MLPTHPYATSGTATPSTWRSEYQASQQNLQESIAKLRACYGGDSSPIAGRPTAMSNVGPPSNFAWGAVTGMFLLLV